ncbi:hypothetical protein MPSEU_000699600 [Mayamaea pseudoterrestris]|nr:hypothetical protein MPSEU_000699600 [Mayamaea pseudoterrestris]
MVAVGEARALLDALMGGDRNAPLPKGAAVPGKKRKHASGGDMLLLPGKRTKSCYDPDICPLYTAWGRDVYELFVNTKSDLGPNPYVVDNGAHEEYLKLPRDEKERLGYDFFLFQKLNELVRQCDRTISRNNEKLRQEMARKGIQRADVPEQVDDAALDYVCRMIVQAEDLQDQIDTKAKALEDVLLQEGQAKQELEPLLQDMKAKVEERGADADADGEQPQQESEPDPAKERMTELQTKLGALTLERGRLLYDLGQLISRLVPLQDDVAYHRRQLDYVKSDITTDKTVCEVSGNFMSARDADERIAAHYSGKQYVGWKLVRDKLASMQKLYGRYGPPPPAQRRNDGPPPSMGMGGGGGFRNGGRSGDDRGGRGFGGGGGSSRFDDRGGYRAPPPGRFDDRGFRGGPPPGGRRW